jgi:arylsulfatase A-like enzyme
MAPAPWNELIDPDDVPAPIGHATQDAEAAEHPMAAAALAVEMIRAPEDPEAIRRMRATYWGMLAEVDEKLGRVLDHLDRTGRRDRTLVIVTADHGSQLGDHHLMQKLGWFESSYHVPLIVAGAGVSSAAAGTIVDRFTESIDLMPTILDAVGAAVPTQCEGAPLTTFLRGQEPRRWRNAAHWEWDFRSADVSALLGIPHAASNLAVLRDADGKYVHFAAADPIFYDLVVDPDELVNRAAEPDDAVRLAAYAGRMLTWRMRHDDQSLATYVLEADGPHLEVDDPLDRL